MAAEDRIKNLLIDLIKPTYDELDRDWGKEEELKVKELVKELKELTKNVVNNIGPMRP